MVARYYFLLFATFVLIFNHQTIGHDLYTNNQCGHFNFWCNSSLPRPCCDENNICKQYSIGLSQCVMEEQQRFQSSCTVDKDCEQILHAICSKDKQCVCKPKHIYMNHGCAPVLGGFCGHDKNCVTINSVCIDHMCKCKEGYSKRFDNQCVRNIIGESCVDDEFCSQIKFAKCLESKRCDCSFNTTAVGGVKCMPILNGFCLKNSDCLPDNSYCVNNKCQCTTGFTSISNNKCIPAFLGGRCDNDDDCIKINHSKCSIDKLCTCENNYIKVNETTCGSLISGLCSRNEECIVTYSHCIDNVCQCEPGTVLKFTNNTVCAGLLDRFCNTDEQCGLDNSVCVDNKCQCSLYSKRQSNDQCSNYLEQNCTTNEDCFGILYAECSTNNICVCEENYYYFNETLCLPLLGGHCVNDEDCLVGNSHCVNKVCQCKLDYKPFYNDGCQALYLNQACYYDENCAEIENAKCSEDKKCVCQVNHSASGVTKCLAHIGEFCRNNDDCVSKTFSVCVHNKCQCIDKFVSLQSNDQCVPIKLGRPCKINEDCSLVTNAICSENKICACRNNFSALTDFSCGPPLGELCSDDENCFVSSSVCIDNECQCKPNFSPASHTQCVQTNLLYSCDDDLDCGDPWHFKCSEDKKCVCNTNNLLIDKSTCLPLLGGLCWTDKQCSTIKGSSCVDYHCQCSSNFNFISKNACLPN